MPLTAFDFYKVLDIRALKTHTQSDEAQKILERVADQVQPIMRARWLKVPLLSEFFPKKSNLQGLNIGGGNSSTREIKLRLRPASNSNVFLPFDYILGTMLHELCHNTISPHNAAFYSLLKELTTECEDLMMKGLTRTGQGFDAPSVGRVGGSWQNPSILEARTKGLKAAEQRQVQNARNLALAPKGPQLLGGSLKLMTPAQAAAWAAEKRAQDQTACGNDEEHGTNVGYNEHTNEVIILDDSDSEPLSPQESRAIKVQKLVENEVIDLTKDVVSYHSSAPSRKRTSKTQSSKDSSWEWACKQCTFKNVPWSDTCEICNSHR